MADSDISGILETSKRCLKATGDSLLRRRHPAGEHFQHLARRNPHAVTFLLISTATLNSASRSVSINGQLLIL
jgi:hypothetical protein